MQYSTINRNGYHVEHNSLAAAARLAELQQMFAQVQSENTELNRRLSLQNRPGKQLGGVLQSSYQNTRQAAWLAQWQSRASIPTLGGGGVSGALPC